MGGIIPEAGAVGKDKAELSINIPLSLLPDWAVLSNWDTKHSSSRELFCHEFYHSKDSVNYYRHLQSKFLVVIFSHV